MVGVAVAGSFGFGMERTVIDGRDRRVLCLEALLHEAGEIEEIFFAVVAATNPGLIGDDHDCQPAAASASDKVEDPREPLEILARPPRRPRGLIATMLSAAAPLFAAGRLASLPF